MTPAQRMAEAVASESNIGRYKLAEVAKVSDKVARTYLEKLRKPSQFIHAVSLHDWHVPYHDKAAVNCAFNFIEHIKPQFIIIHEVHDWYSLSRFNKDPDRATGKNLQYEFDVGHELMLELKKRSPLSLVKLLNSNHQDRLERYLCSDAKGLKGLRSLALPKLLRMDELKIQMLPNFSFREFFWKHGSIVRKDSAYTAKGEFDREGLSGASGHTHRLGAYYKSLRGGRYVWVEGGCLCDLHPEYIGDDVANWQHGCSVVSFEPEGRQFYARDVPIIDGKMIWGNEIITG